MSTVWHARAAGGNWHEAYMRLTPEERTDIDDWKIPTDIILNADTGLVLRWDEAIKEMAVGLGDWCEWVDPKDPNALTAGTCDFHWYIDGVLYVGDLKKSEYTEPDGPRSLQVRCYALALAAGYAKLGNDVKGYVCGIWHAQEGTWEWGAYVALDSAECARDWEEVSAAANHIDGEFNKGTHCRRCYARQRCPAYLMPPGEMNGELARYLSGQLDNGTALELRLALERVKDTVAAADQALRAYADATGGIRDGQGKVWRPVECQGRPGLDARALEREEPDVFRQFYKRGAPYSMYRWTKEES